MPELSFQSRRSHRSVPPVVPRPSHRDVRVLIVHDSRPFRAVARELLERRGYHVIGEAGSACEAIDAIDDHPPDAVLLDVGLHDGSGGAVAAYLRTRYPAVAVRLVSADTGAAHKLI